MKKINAFSWLITMLMTIVSSPAFATDWNSENVTMQVGEIQTLYLPSYVTSKSMKSVTFYSASWNDVEVLSHTNYSVRVKALKATSTPVIVRCDYYYYINNGGYTYQNGGAYDFRITVEGESIVKPAKITLPSVVSVEVGESKDIEATVTPANAEYTLTWSISDNSIATVYQNGMITGKSVGYADLKVKADNGVYAMCRVSVYRPTPSSVSMKSSLAMNVGDTYTLSPTVYPSNSQYTLTWTSSNTNVATVSSSGMVIAKSAGTTNITVKTDNGKTATCYVTVSAKAVTSVSIPSGLSLEVGETHTLTPTITPSDASTSYTWSSDNNSVVTVSQSGVLTANNGGTANITVKTDNGKTATCKVTVSSKSVTNVNIPSTLSLEVGETYTLNPTITPTDAVTSYTWSSDNINVATVSQSGMVVAKSAGTANITVKTDGGQTATCKVTVKAAIVKEYEVSFSIYGYEHGQVLYNGKKLAGPIIDDIGSFNVNEGSDVALTFLPEAGYKIDWLWVDYEDVIDQLVNNVLTLHNVKKDLYLVVSFEKGEQPVVIVPVSLYCNVGDGGYITHGNTTIKGESKISVFEGDDIAVKIVANEGFHIDAVKVDGTDVKSRLVENELTIKNMTADKNLLVTFEADKTYPDEPVITTENTMTLSDVTANIGTAVTFPIGLNNVDEITALQMDLHLPIGITLATDEDGDVKIESTSRVSNKHTLDCSKMADGGYRIICYSSKNIAFTGQSGELFNVKLAVGEGMADGDYEITATNIEISDIKGTAYTVKDASGTITVQSYMMGDVDGNGQHSINDVVCIINRVLNRPNTAFIETAADLDGSGEISVNDAVLLISKYILGTSSNVRKAMRTAEVGNGANFLHIEDLEMQPGEVKTIEVMMTNQRDDIRGLQCDITLPDGLSFLYDEDVDDYVTATTRVPRKLALSSEMQAVNTLRVAGVCTGSSCIYGNDGSVFTFKVKADENMTSGKYKVLLSNMELSYGEAIQVNDRTSLLEILSPTDGITSLSLDGKKDVIIYDLSGRRTRASEAKKGVFIVNGKKVLIK